MSESTPRVLLVEDQGFIADSIMGILGEAGRDQWPLSTIEPQGAFKWSKTPRAATAFLEQQAGIADAWQPDVALVDYHYETESGAGDDMTGLSVLDALARHAPTTEVVIFSGHATRQGRSLFQAAAYHWFGIRRSLPKGGTARDLADLLAGKDSTPPALATRLHDKARLIDAFFPREPHLAVLRTWGETRGNDKVIDKVIHSSRPTITRCKRELATAADEFARAFDVKVSDVSGRYVNDTDRLRPSKEILGEFMANNHSFFADPVLEAVLRRWGPWGGA